MIESERFGCAGTEIMARGDTKRTGPWLRWNLCRGIAAPVACCVIFLCVTVSSSIALGSAAKVVQEVVAPRAESVKLVIEDFSKLEGNDRFDFLGRAIVELIQVGLLPYEDQVQVISRSRLWKALDEMAVPRAEFSESRIFKQQVYEYVGADFVLQGHFEEFDGFLNISAALRNVHPEEGQEKTVIIDLEPIVIEWRNLLPRSNELAEVIVDVLSDESDSRFTLPHIVVSCFRSSGDEDTEAAEWVSTDLAMAVTRMLSHRRGVVVRSIMDIYGECRTDSELIGDELQVDAVIGGYFKLEGPSISISPTIHIPERRSLGVYDLPQIRDAEASYQTLRNRPSEV